MSISPWPARRRALLRLCELASQWARESIVHHQAVTATDVPRSAREITPEWLTAVLCKDAPGARVTGVQMHGGSSGTSTRARLQLDLNDAARDAGVPATLFTKSTPRLTQRVMMGFSGIIGSEVGFYPQIRPQLDIEAPLGYHACLDRDSWRSMVLIEDVVATRGARFITTDTHITQTMMKQLLANMARWHGQYWESPQLRGPLSWLRTPADFLATISPLGFRFMAHQGLRRASNVVAPYLLARTDECWQALNASLELNSREPRTLLHGDPHISQVYVTRDGRLGYGDWQIVMQGGWAFDVAYAIVSALSVDDRRAWESDLLRFYLNQLQTAGGPDLPFDLAWHRYRQNMLYPYFCWLMTIAGPIMPVLPNMQPDQVSRDIIERTSNAIVDLDSIAAVRQA